VHWIGWLERHLVAIATIRAAEIALLLVAMSVIARFLPAHEALEFIEAGIGGIVAFVLVEGIGTVLEAREEARKAAGIVMRSGLGGSSTSMCLMHRSASTG
jgi:hypothetical protein